VCELFVLEKAVVVFVQDYYLRAEFVQGENFLFLELSDVVDDVIFADLGLTGFK